MIDSQNPQIEVESPCNKICTLDAAEICIGCGRSLAEIAAWAQASNRQRRQIVDAAAKRLAALSETGKRASA